MLRFPKNERKRKVDKYLMFDCLSREVKVANWKVTWKKCI